MIGAVEISPLPKPMPNNHPRPNSPNRLRRPRTVLTDVELSVRQRTSVTFWVGVAMYVTGALTLVVGLALLLAALPQFPLGPQPEAVGQVRTLSTADTITLRWTAPGDDGTIGQASRYDIRYATGPMTEQNFSSTTPVSNPPYPQAAGREETLSVTGLQPATTYYFGLKTADEVPNWSPLSNVASASTATTSAACTPRWTCTDWSSCQDGRRTRRCVDNNNCNTTVDKPVEEERCTAPPPAEGTCREDWSCTDWSTCQNGNQSRTCQDRNTCGTTTSKPAEAFDCSTGAEPPDEDPDILAVVPARRAPARVRVYDRSLRSVASFLAFPGRQRTGGTVAVGDTDGDDILNVVVGAGYGASPQVRVFSPGSRQVIRFQPFAATARVGAQVAAGDVDGDGIEEIAVTPIRGATSRVIIYQYNEATGQYRPLTTLTPFGRGHRGGARLLLVDLNEDDHAELLVASAGQTTPLVRIFDYQSTTKKFTARRSFLAFPSRTRVGLHLSAGDVDNDGAPEVIISRDAGVPPVVRLFNPEGQLKYQFAAASARFRGGVTTATIDLDEDGQAEVVTAVAQSGPSGLFFFRFDRAERRFVRVKILTPFGSSVRGGLRMAGSAGL